MIYLLFIYATWVVGNLVALRGYVCTISSAEIYINTIANSTNQQIKSLLHFQIKKIINCTNL